MPAGTVIDTKGLPISITPAPATQQGYWRVRKLLALTPEQSHGIHNVYGRCFGSEGQRLLGVPLRLFWPTGEARGVTEEKPLNEWGDWNAPLYGPWNPQHGPGPYGVEVADGAPSEAAVGMGLPQNLHYSYVVEWQWQPPTTPPAPTPTPPPGADWRAELLAEAQQRQVLRLNPAASLQRAILRAGFVPTSEEFPQSIAGVAHTAQRAERLSDGAVRVYFVPNGMWDQVEYVEGAGAG